MQFNEEVDAKRTENTKHYSYSYLLQLHAYCVSDLISYYFNSFEIVTTFSKYVCDIIVLLM